MSKETLFLIFKIGLLICSGLISFSFIAYLRKYKVFSTIFAKVRGKVDVYNKNKQEQIKLKLESGRFSEKRKFSLLDKALMTIKQTGILRYMPGFNEMHVLIIYLTALVVTGGILSARMRVVNAIIVTIAVAIVVRILCSFIIYEKKERLEAQLSSFINACEGASAIRADIIDIFGEIYENTRQPLRGLLEECYIEAKKTNDKKSALRHMRDKTDSIQFRSIIDNLELCSEITGDYGKVIEDIRTPIRIYQGFKTRRKAIVRNGRVNILVMCGISIVILFTSMQFMEGLKDFLFQSPIGFIMMTTMCILFISGLTIRTKD